jgi:hypothetical protein
VNISHDVLKPYESPALSTSIKADWGILHPPDLLHLLLALLLLFPELALARDIAAIALGGDILGDGAQGLPRDDLAADGGLDGDLELLHRDDLEQGRAENLT